LIGRYRARRYGAPTIPGEASVKALIDFLIIAPARLSAVFADLPPLAARLTAGYVFMMTGWAKLHALPQMIQNFTE
jgi:putative oxidoreductase